MNYKLSCVIKESTNRADELTALGWTKDDIARYVELWEYRQRWGAINLERDDRQFLRKAEAALPVISTNKASIKKPIKEKSYYRRLSFYVEAMDKVESKLDIPVGSRGIWPILLEEELRLLDYYEPVLGLPDTIKAKILEPFREKVVQKLLKEQSEDIQLCSFDFSNPLEELKAKESVSWRPLREGVSEGQTTYPVLKPAAVLEARKEVRNDLIPLIRNTFPSLIETDKPEPPDDWILE